MPQFILTNILMLSLGVILYVVVRTLPRVDETAVSEKKGAWERWLASGMPERIDRALNGFLFKLLKRVRVLLLKADNAVSGQLKKVKKEENGGAAKSGVDFRAIKEENKEGSH